MRKYLVVMLTAVLMYTALNGPVFAGESLRAVLVTGASSGIGRRITETLADRGYFVYAGARKAADISALSDLNNVQGIRLDVTDQEEIDAAVEYVREQGKGLYGLVNNAGIFLYDPLIEVSEADMRFIIDVNVLGPYRVTKAFAPLIIENRGRITTTGSIASIYASRLFGPYSLSKSAMDAYTEALASEMRKFDVAVSIVQPGNFRSNIMRNMQQRKARTDGTGGSSLWAEEIAGFANFTRVDRSAHADPQPVADAVLSFMSAEAPRLRYMVTPNEGEAVFAMRSALKRAVELNEGHRYSLDRDDLVAMLDELLSSRVKP